MVEEQAVTQREAILGRVREALASGLHSGERRHSPAPHSDWRRCLPDGGDTIERQLELFRKNAADLRARFELLNTSDELSDRIRTMRETERWRQVASHRGVLAEAACTAAGVPVLWSPTLSDMDRLEACSAGITECDALVSQTGSVLVTSSSAGGRALSVLPPHHVVVARRAQLVPDLAAAFELLKRKYAPNYPSFISLITGPSRTGDIERTLVLGAHGPRQLTILCM